MVKYVCMKNGVDPDQLGSVQIKPADLGQHYIRYKVK